jgi:amino acid adenylation domain-containing protein
VGSLPRTADLQPVASVGLRPLERSLAALWTELLGRPVLRRQDNFFELGGHSLLGTRLMALVRERFNIDLPLRGFFEEPTLGGQADQIEQQIRLSGGKILPSIEPVLRRDDPIPTSFGQQRLWFIQQMEKENVAYNISAAVRIRGRVNITALEQAVLCIITRHETLRTTFADLDGTPHQVISSKARLDLPIVDIEALKCAENPEQIISLGLRQESRRAFDLTQGPLLRASLFRANGGEHIFSITMHHIISDGWSMSIFVRELLNLYEAYTHSDQSTLPWLPLQYADYAVWQRDLFKDVELETEIGFWRGQVSGIEPLALPADRPRPSIQTYSGARQTLFLDGRLVGGLRLVGQENNATLFMTLLASFQVLLSRYSGQDDISVGTPIAGRTQIELEPLIGMFVNMLIMRSRVDSRVSFRQLLSHVRETALGAYAHQHLPFEKLIEALRPSRDLSRTPLIQAMLILHNEPDEPLAAPALDIERIVHDSETSKFDVTLSLSERDSGLAGFVEYNTDLFDAETIARMVDHFIVLLGSITANPGARISSLSLLSGAELNQVLVDWNQTQTDYDEDRSVNEIFESQAGGTPDALAITAGDEQITYGCLNQRANQFAWYLRALGIAQESPVIVCLPRSISLITTLLGILKASGCYVPVDPSLPLDRLEFMLTDSGARMAVTEYDLRPGSLPGDVTIVRPKQDWPDIARQPAAPLKSETTVDALLYLMYTSGSTGKPKAVLGTHRGAINRFRWMWNEFAFSPTDVCCMKTSGSFVDSVWECFGPLLAGIRTVIIPDKDVANAEEFFSILASREVTRIVLVPSLIESLVSQYPNLGSRLPSLRFWISSGESLKGHLVESFARSVPKAQLVNLYGCSEVAADATWHEYSENHEEDSPTIGRPIANTQVHVLATDMNPCPPRIPGEICLGGVGLARGYFGRSDATADRFVPNPFNRACGSRLYRTGDLGRYRPDGVLEFIGRTDNQVKLRGYRIETEEVERVLVAHPGVQQALVTLTGDQSSDKRLVAYFVPNRAVNSTVRELHSHSARFLPAYMVPSAYIAIDAFPLLASGKIDRSALPHFDRSHTLLATTQVDRRPSTPIEKSLIAIWREVLGLDAVGLNDNFFDLGGHSLALLRVKAEILKRTGKEVALADLFTYPTVGLLSQRLADQSPASDVVAAARKRGAMRRGPALRNHNNQHEAAD